MHKLKGDTLIEVALAIGIFSLVAITVVSVVSASTSSAQSALETTITREEIDAQAEALRFIHESYISGNQGEDPDKNPYKALWEALVPNNKVPVAKTEGTSSKSNIKEFKPEACSEIYNGEGNINVDSIYSSDKKRTPFILNIRKLNTYNPAKIIIESNSDHKIFYAPTTYPRIIYGESSESVNDLEDSSLLDQMDNENRTLIKRVEGLYIVVEAGEHKVVSGAAASVDDKPAYYDFYIRSCWMPLGSDRASTVSTVVRLYDPDAITY